MLSSLVYGCGSLEAVKKKNTTYIQQKVKLGNIEIGEGKQSDIPDFIQQVETKMIIGDIAGLEDQAQEYVQLKNILVFLISALARS